MVFLEERGEALAADGAWGCCSDISIYENTEVELNQLREEMKRLDPGAKWK